MNLLVAAFAKAFLYLSYKKDEYLFWRSKKYVTAWGEGSYGMPMITSYDKRSVLSVGSYVSIASNTTILLGANHTRGLVTTYPIDRIMTSKTTTDANEKGNVSIGSDVWIGYGVTIIGEVKIGDGAIVGAHALVVDDVPPYAVVGGVPAKVIKYRFPEEERKKLQEIAWWNWEKKVIVERADDIYSDATQKFIDKYHTSS